MDEEESSSPDDDDIILVLLLLLLSVVRVSDLIMLMLIPDQVPGALTRVFFVSAGKTTAHGSAHSFLLGHRKPNLGRNKCSLALIDGRDSTPSRRPSVP